MDWLAETGAPRATYERALANAFPTLELAAPAVIDPGDPDAGTYAIPARTVELAHELADRWGLHGDTPSFGYAPSFSDLISDPAAPAIGLSGYPGISELAEGLGLK